jgi:superoxide dismutase, Cu-Zn family
MRHALGSMLAAMTMAAIVGAMACSSRSTAAGGAGPADARAAAARPAGAAPARRAGGPPGQPGAVASLASADDPRLSGTATFTQLADAVRVEIDVRGVDRPGPHGLHLHEAGSCEPGPPGKRYAAAGAHFNPGGAAHACPDSTSHHAGDFGNLEVQPDGSGHYVRVTALLSLTGPSSPIGRTLILHRGEDDCKTQPAGNSGERLACGVVEAAPGVAPGRKDR